MSKIAPSARLREEIAAFLEQAEGSESGGSALSRLVQLATARLVQEALEQEQTDFIGRERYARRPGQGKRNGYVPGQLDTAEGRVRIQVPQVREAGAPYRSVLYDFLRATRRWSSGWRSRCTRGSSRRAMWRRRSPTSGVPACSRGAP